MPLVSMMVMVDDRDSESDGSDTIEACGVESPGRITRAAKAIIPIITTGARIFKFNLSRLGLKIIKKLFQFHTNFFLN
jgi:hypothetical protein